MPNIIKTIELKNGIWQLAECDADGNDFVDAYLVCGNERAVLIDALCTVTGLYECVRKLTGLPLDVVMTHGHIDHVGASTPEFFNTCGVYIDARDIFLTDALSGADGVKELSDGQVFELGGKRLEVISVPGHTPGSVVLLDRENEIIFTGDTVGSGSFWMQLPESLPLAAFDKNLDRLCEIVATYGGLTVYVGHRSQGSPTMTGTYIEDVSAATKRILDGTLTGIPSVMRLGETELKMCAAEHGTMKNYCYDPLKIYE